MADSGTQPGEAELKRYLLGDSAIDVELVEDDATQLSLPSDTFDLVHERTVLLNVADPGRVLAEMVRIAEPGGIVAVQQPDSAGWICDPPHPAWEVLRGELLEAYLTSGKNFDRGRTAARMLSEAGLGDVQVRVTARPTRRGDYYHTFLLALTAILREQILASGRLRTAEFDDLREQLRAHLEQEGSLTCQPTMWQAWGVKP
jgi:SAM-dependent methyltransferase